MATSLSAETGKTYVLDECFGNLISFVEARYLQMRQGDKSKLVREYESRLYWANEPRQFESSSRGVFQGSILGIDSSGRLRMSIGRDEVAFDLKEITYIK